MLQAGEFMLIAGPIIVVTQKLTAGRLSDRTVLVDQRFHDHFEPRLDGVDLVDVRG
jgi:hypothetical protein